MMLRTNIAEGLDILPKQRSEVYDMLLTEFDEERYERTLRQDAYEDGREDVNKLNEILLSEGRIEDLRKSTINQEYQNQLMKEFGLL